MSKYIGISDESKPHSTVLAGALQTAEIYNRLIYGKQFLDEFD